jgi:hypothetical protein
MGQAGIPCKRKSYLSVLAVKKSQVSGKILLLNALKFYLKLKLLNFQNQKTNFQKTKVDGGLSPHVKFMPGVNPPTV